MARQLTIQELIELLKQKGRRALRLKKVKQSIVFERKLMPFHYLYVIKVKEGYAYLEVLQETYGEPYKACIKLGEKPEVYELEEIWKKFLYANEISCFPLEND